MNTVIANLRAIVPKVFICTIPPKTTSTDNWATTANQSVNFNGAGTETCRLNVNSSIRGTNIGAGVLASVNGVIDIEGIVGTTRGSDGAIVWQPGATGDGVHPLQAMAASIASTLNPKAYI